MSKAAYAVVLFCLLSGTALAEGIEDKPLPAAISLVKENGSLKFTDDNGQSLYVFDRDTADHSACDGACAAQWQPVSASSDANKIGDWTPFRRSDNTMQWGYKDRPVYTYRGDKQPGQTNGSGAGGVWHVLTP